jgi:hypothetical protein
VQEDFARVANAIARFEPVKMVVDPSALASAKALCGPNIELIPLAVNDSWCRDSGPSFVCHPQQGLAGELALQRLGRQVGARAGRKPGTPHSITWGWNASARR